MPPPNPPPNPPQPLTPPWAHIVVNNTPGTPPSGPPKLRAASNALKHGLYSTQFAFSTASDHNLFAILLHDFRHEYQPITATESSLVQELAELKFRHLKIQKLHAAALAEEVYRQAKSADPTPLGQIPSETDIEARAYLKLIESSPGFRLFQRELERLPNRIHKVIARLHTNLKLRDDLAYWTHHPYPSHTAPEPAPAPEPTPLAIDLKSDTPSEQKSEDKSKTKETKSQPTCLTWPPHCATRFEFYKVWDEGLKEEARQIVLHGEDRDYRRQTFFKRCGQDLAQIKAWLAQRDFENESKKENEGKKENEINLDPPAAA